MSAFWLWLKPRGLDRFLAANAPRAVKEWESFVETCLENRTIKQAELNKNPKPESEIRKDFFHWLFKAVDPETGEPEKWRYEMWFFSENRIVYAIHGGPMAGRINYQTCTFQCIRPDELWQCNWLEETGTICSLVYDITKQTISTLLAFSQGHWDRPKEAHGDKRDPVAFDRWRELAKIGRQSDRFMLTEQAHIIENFKGSGDLEAIDGNAITL